MKRSARTATLFIIFFFLFFNGVQVYLILQRISGAKMKFSTACSDVLIASIFQYNKIQDTVRATRPRNAMITWSLEDMAVNRVDSQNIAVGSPNSRLFARRVDPAAIEGLIGGPRVFKLDLAFLNQLYRKALDSINIHSGYRLDTFPINTKPGVERKDISQQIREALALKRNKAYPIATNAQRIFFYPGALVFAEHHYDYHFFRKELFWPLLGFFVILLISNTALFIVYRTIRKQKRVNELKTDFINNMTHEMKTPITIALAGLEALEHHIPAAERTSFYLRTSKKQLHLLNEFGERILDAAVRDMSDFALKKERIDLFALFREIVQSHSIIQNKEVSFQLNGEGPVYIEGDRLHLETAFHNMIDNAIKYSKGPVEISIDIMGNNRDSLIRIRDNGMGIAAQYIPHLFDKFFRVPQGDTQPIKGFGLGLYYVSNIIKKHAGHITVQSKKDSGTEFTITLPNHS